MSDSPSRRTLILGSTSPYRRELMQRLRLPFEVQRPEVDETPLSGEKPADLALRLALAKAQAVAQRFPQAIVIGSDQVADLHGEPLGKPGNHANAVAQLQQMRGQTVVFQTAVSVVCMATGFAQSELAQVKVQFLIQHQHPVQPHADEAGLLAVGVSLIVIERWHLHSQPVPLSAGQRKRHGAGAVAVPAVVANEAFFLLGAVEIEKIGAAGGARGDDRIGLVLVGPGSEHELELQRIWQRRIKTIDPPCGQRGKKRQRDEPAGRDDIHGVEGAGRNGVVSA